MPYHQMFDRLGNRLETERPRATKFHRWVQRIGFGASAVLLCVLIWGPK